MSINSETAHLHQSNSQLLLSRTRLVIQSMINLGSCYKEKFMVTWPRAYVFLCACIVYVSIRIHRQYTMEKARNKPKLLCCRGRERVSSEGQVFALKGGIPSFGELAAILRSHRVGWLTPRFP